MQAFLNVFAYLCLKHYRGIELKQKLSVFLRRELTSSTIFRHTKDSHFVFKIRSIIVIVLNFEQQGEWVLRGITVCRCGIGVELKDRQTLSACSPMTPYAQN